MKKFLKSKTTLTIALLLSLAIILGLDFYFQPSSSSAQTTSLICRYRSLVCRYRSGPPSNNPSISINFPQNGATFPIGQLINVRVSSVNLSGSNDSINVNIYPLSSNNQQGSSVLNFRSQGNNAGNNTSLINQWNSQMANSGPGQYQIVATGIQGNSKMTVSDTVSIRLTLPGGGETCPPGQTWGYHTCGDKNSTSTRGKCLFVENSCGVSNCSSNWDCYRRLIQEQ